MANDMTVEELIGLLQEEYPQALVLIEKGDIRYHRFGGLPVPCNILVPHGLQVRASPRNGCVYIICD